METTTAKRFSSWCGHTSHVSGAGYFTCNILKMHCPQVRLDPESRRKFLTDPTLVALELTFGILSVGNVLVLHYLISVAIPFPITITWFQFLIGLVYARILGEFGREYPQMAYFVPLKLEFKQVMHTHASINLFVRPTASRDRRTAVALYFLMMTLFR